MSRNIAYVINDPEALQLLLNGSKAADLHRIYTENPAIYEWLGKNEYQVKSLSFLPTEYLKELDNIAFKISTAWHRHINQFCRESGSCQLNIGDTINTYIFRLISLLFYRSSQLNHLRSIEKEIVIPFFENQEAFDTDSFRNLVPDIDYWRVFTQSGHYDEQVKPFPLCSESPPNKPFYESNVSIHPSFWKHYLLAFSVDPFWIGREILFKLMPKTSSFRFKNYNGNRFTALIYDRNRILERAWTPMKLKHIRLARFDTPVFNIPDALKLKYKNADPILFHSMLDLGRGIVDASEAAISDLSPAIELSARRIAKFVTHYLIPLQHTIYPFMANWTKDYCKQPTVLVSNNSLNNPVSSMIGQSLSKNGVPVVVFEHGAPGLSKLQRAHTFFTDLRYWDGFVAYSPYQEEYYTRHTGDKSRNIFVRGFSHVARAGFPRLARLFSRSLAGLKPGEKVVLYAPTRFRYHSIRLYYEYFDIPYWEFMKDLVINVFGNISYKVLIKMHRKGLLPSRDFRDNPLEDIQLSSNIEITGTPDMKYLRYAGDILILDWLSSVFEWMITCENPLIYLNLVSDGVEDDILDMVKKAIFVIDIDNGGGWKTELMELINLPKSEIDSLWHEKKYARDYFRDNYHIGVEQSDDKMIQWIKGIYTSIKKR